MCDVVTLEKPIKYGTSSMAGNVWTTVQSNLLISSCNVAADRASRGVSCQIA